MQVIRQASRGRSGLRLWNRAPGLRANRKTPHTRQPLTGVTLWGCLVGAVLVFMGSVAFAHTDGEPLPLPTCSELPTAADFFPAAGTADDALLDLAAANVGTYTSDQNLALLPGDETESGKGHSNFHYGKITVPALTAGELSVVVAEGAPAEPTNAVLCRPGMSQPVASDIEAYTAKHRAADRAAEAAQTAADAAGTAVTAARLSGNDKASDEDMVAAVAAARSALVAAEEALVAADLSLITETDAAIDRLDALDPINTEADTTAALTAAQQALYNADSATDNAASVLRAAIVADHMGVDLTAYLNSGVEEYILVVTHRDEGETQSPPAVTVQFKGLMGTSVLEQLVGTTGGEASSATYTFTTNIAGLFMGDTTGRAVSGTLHQGTTPYMAGTTQDVGVDTGTGKVEITAPIITPETYTLTVTDMGTSGGGNVTLSAWFRSSTAIVTTEEELSAGKSNYYHFNEGTPRVLTLKAAADRLMGADTTGVLYSKNGQIKSDVDAEGGRNFEIVVAAIAGDYILEVRGDTAQEAGKFTLSHTGVTATSVVVPSPTNSGVVGATPGYFLVNVPKDGGWIQVKITSNVGDLDTDAELEGPDGSLVMSSKSEGHANFAVMVMMGQHLLTVTGRGTGTGAYNIAVNFIESVAFSGEQPTIPEPGAALVMACDEAIGDGSYMPAGYVPNTGSEFETACREADFVRIVQVGGGGGGGGGGTRTVQVPPSEQACREYFEVDTDATGYLENPNGYRSGVSVISGWACAANRVTLAVYDSDGERVERMQAAYGTSRPDTVGSCDHDSDLTGFGMTYNFNHLPEGTYTMRALADNEMIGSQSFMVVHLTEFAADDNDRFLRDLSGMCTVADFPEIGQETDLEWEQSIQNFVIHEVADVSMEQ